MTTALILSYDKCGTCKKAITWLKDHKVAVDVRPIVEEPPTEKELRGWIEKSGKSIRKWLNTSGLSYRALGKAKVDAAKDAEILAWLARDGKLVKRPVLIAGPRVLVGFREEEYTEALGR